MYFSIIIPFLIAFLVTFFSIPYFEKFFSKIQIIATDMQKKLKPVIPLAGGIPVFFGFNLGVLSYVAINTFILKNNVNLLYLFAAMLTSSIIAMIGFFDDINVRSKRTYIGSGAVDFKVGLKQWQKALLPLIAAIPLMVVYAGATTISVPLLGAFNFGILFPLVLIPLAVVFVSNATNMLAGLNGLEAGSTAVALITLGFFTINSSPVAAIISFTGAASLLAFLKFNWTPARMLPGDSLTYFSGALIVSVVIVGGVERFGIIIFTPWIVEAFLKLRGGFKVRSYGDLQKDGTIKAPYDKIYSLTHFVMKLPEWLKIKRFTEKQITLILIGFEILICLLSLAYLH
jgi:UDP-N-acetylglucosamine--dolichyl-phosphate N-acetylglucosaminephosphotransferase